MRRSPAAALAVLCVLTGVLTDGSAQARVARFHWRPPVAVDRRGGGLAAVSCPSVKLCVAIDGKGYVLTTSAPGGPAGRWARTGARIFGASHPQPRIDCRSARLCAVADQTSEVVVSRRPTGGGVSSWLSVPIDPAARVQSISCPSIALCVAVDDRGNILSTTTPTTPTSGASAWRIVRVDPAADDGQEGIYAVSCPSARFCAAVDDQGNVLTSTRPSGDSSAWQIVPLYTGIGSAGGLLDVSCPSARLCAAVDGGAGDILISREPTGGQKTWSALGLSPGINQNDAGSLDYVRCDFTTLCVAADNLGHVYTSTDPAGRASAWSTAEFELVSVSCPSSYMCVAVQGDGSVRLGDRHG